MHEMNYQTDGFQRSYRIHFPSNYNPEKIYPLVVVVHGAFDTAEGIEEVTGFSRLADREGFIVMYPNGIGIFGFLQHWNAGHCCGKAAEDHIDDVGFVTRAIKEVAGRFRIDRRRIYMTGFSNGGMFTYLFGAKKSHLLAAIAPVAASFGGQASAEDSAWQPPIPEKPLPVLVMHGLEDNYVPYAGGTSERRGGTATFLPVWESVQFWVKWNQCAGDPVKQELFSNMVHTSQWTACRSRVPVILYTLDNWRHYWPGPYDARRLDANHPLKTFNAAEIIWDFFKHHSGNGT